MATKTKTTARKSLKLSPLPSVRLPARPVARKSVSRKQLSPAKIKMLAPVNLPVVEEFTIAEFVPVQPRVSMDSEIHLPKMYPNTTPIQIEIRTDGSLLKSARAGFYLGVIVGVITMSLLVIIAYVSFLNTLISRV